MMKKLLIFSQFWPLGALIYILLAKITLIEGSAILPDQLHCVAEVLYKNWENTIDWYIVEEYVDFPRQRSATKFLNVSDSREKIIYNQVNPPGRLSRRKFITYDVQEDTCFYRDFLERPLAKIRSLIIYMLSIDRLNTNLCDVVIGPSALLMTIESSLGDYSFSRREFSQQQLIKTDIFEAVYDKDPDLIARDQSVLVTVQIPAESKLTLMYNKTLADLDKSIQFLQVQVCRIRTKDLKLRMPGSEYTCNAQEMVIKATFYIVTSFISGSLVGRELDQSRSFDFERDPFVQSIGVGCWRAGGFMGQKRFTPPTKQFSAEYETKNGDFDSSYIAFDGNINLLRLDRNDRKNVYDLDRRKSYHVDKFVSREKFMQEESCIVLDISGDERIDEYFGMEQLIGFGFNGDGANPFYLGSKTVDHTTYEVYESEYDIEKFGGNFPILLETRGYNPHQNGTKYFLTYFMDEYKLEMDVKGGSSSVGENENRISLPRFVELWAVGPNRTKKLVNSLKFNAFSWALDIEPANDNSFSTSGNLFFIDSCAQDRSSQVQLRLSVKESENYKLPKKMQSSFRKRKDLIHLILQQEVSSVLDVSPLNIAQIATTFIHETLDLVVNTKFVELVEDDSRQLLLGYVEYSEFVNGNQASILTDSHNRHSLNDCKLDSMMERTKNRMMYCKSLARCLIVDAKAFENKEIRKQPDARKDDDEDEVSVECHVYRIDWLPTFSSKDHGESLRSKIEANLFKLTKEKQKVQLEFKFRERGKEVEYAKYKGDISALGGLKILESTGLADSRALLTGLRYVMNKDEGYMGVNEVISMDLNEEDSFKYCQLACQQDEYCQSFSFCSRPKLASIFGDCILSNLWLNREHVNEIGRMILEADGKKKEVNFLLPNNSEMFKFIKDSSCNLHPKDFLSSFVTSASVYLRPEAATISSSSQMKLRNFMPESLEECAALSHDISLWSYEMQANFTYCPLSTYCIVNGVPTNILEQAFNSLDEFETCHLYEKSHKQLYDSFIYNHLVLTSSNGVEPISKEDKQVSKDYLSHSSYTIDRESCARLCNLRSSNCLSFDFCQKNPKSNSVCVRYSIRSPESSIDERKGLLVNEKQFYGNSKNSTATLVAVTDCNHYSLKTSYADIRVKQILSDSPYRTKEDDKTNQFEDSVIRNENQQIISEQSNELIERAKLETINTKELTQGLMRNAFLSLLGAAIGCLSFLYATQLYTFILDTYETTRTRLNRRHREPRISQLGLTNNIGAYPA